MGFCKTALLISLLQSPQMCGALKFRCKRNKQTLRKPSLQGELILRAELEIAVSANIYVVILKSMKPENQTKLALHLILFHGLSLERP